jgi:hypothetical protein
MMGIIRWRMAQCEKAGVRFRFNTWAEAADVLAAPDAVILATGGLPITDVLERATIWWYRPGISCRAMPPPGENVLVYDDAGDHAPGLQAAERIAATGGGRVEIVTPDRSFAPEVMGMNLTPYVRALQAHGAVFTVTWRLRSVRRDGNGLVAVLGTDYGPATQERRVDQVVVNHGTRPLGRSLPCAEAPVAQPGRGGLRRTGCRPPAGGGPQPRRAVPAVAHRRRGRIAQYPRGDPGCLPPCAGALTRQSSLWRAAKAGATVRQTGQEESPMLDGLDVERQTAAAWFRSLRDDIVAAFEALEDRQTQGPTAHLPAGRFEVTETRRHSDDGSDAGGGLMSVMRGGRVFEKVGVNVSTVYGSLGPAAQKAMAARGVPGMDSDPRFWASGISLVAHMQNPHAPAVHMNTRMFWTPHAWWFGGGPTLTPASNMPRIRPISTPCRKATLPRMAPTSTPGSRPGRTNISSCRTGAGRGVWVASSWMTATRATGRPISR